MRYRRASTGAWTDVHPISIHEDGEDVISHASLGWPTWYVGQITEWSYPSDTLNVWTNNH